MSSSQKVDVVFACKPSLYSAIALESLLNSTAVNVISVVESTAIKTRGGGSISDIVCLIRESGIKYSLYLAWVTFVFSFVAQFSHRKSISKLCRQNAIPVVNTEDVNSASFQHYLSTLSRENGERLFFLTVMFNQKLSKQVLAIEDIEFINLHPGALPKYRGVDPVFEAMCHQEREVFASLHRVEEEIDTGNILAQQSCQLSASDTLLSANIKVFSAGSLLLSDFFSTMCERDSKEELAGKEQNGEAGYFSWPNKNDVASGPKLFTFGRWC